MICVCQHPQTGHGDEGCEAIVAPGTFCSCSGFRADARWPEIPLQMDPGFRARMRQSLGDEWLPDWTAHARCKSAELHDGGLGPNRPGQPFIELTDKDDLKDGGIATRLPERSLLFQIGRLCAPCPVRRQCLHYAYEVVDGLKHHVEGDDEDDSAGRAYGIFGGVPGRLREHFRHDEEGANDWFQDLARSKGWSLSESIEREESA